MAMWLSITFIFWFIVWVGISANGNCTKYIHQALILWLVSGGVPVLIFKLVG